MAIKATYSFGATVLENHHFRIDRIWGSKREGWNAFVGVYKKPTDDKYVENFHVTAPYVEGENPYPLLYAEVLKQHFVKEINNGKEEKEQREEVSQDTAKPKSRGRKKNSA